MMTSTDIIIPKNLRPIYYHDPASYSEEGLILPPPAPGGGGVGPTYYVPTTSSNTGAAMTTGQAVAVLGVGLLIAGVMIQAAEDAERDIKPLHEAVSKLSLDEMLRDDLRGELANAAWLNSSEPTVLEEDTLNVTTAFEKSAAAGSLVVQAYLSINTNADELTVTIAPSYFPKADNLKALLKTKQDKKRIALTPDKSLYRNYLSFRTQAPQAMRDKREVNIAAWTADDGAAIKSALKTGVRETVTDAHRRHSGAVRASARPQKNDAACFHSRRRQRSRPAQRRGRQGRDLSERHTNISGEFHFRSDATPAAEAEAEQADA
jgi:hypothetical protein